ncbi:MAG: tetratricopeptide repeat protein [Ruminococcaceae bacterium]|nr:tetratricopeptide repeat protein [Oscillospiraceae bacterium]
MKKILCFFLLFVLLCSSVGVQGATETEDSVSQRLHQIQELYEGKRYEDCIEMCEQVLVEAPYTKVYYCLGFSYYKLKQYDEAFEVFSSYLKENPLDENALYQGARFAALCGEREQCGIWLKRLVEMDDTEKQAISNDSAFDSVREEEWYQNLMEISVFIGGEQVEFDVPPLIYNDRTLLPMRAVLEAFGAVVSYDGETRTAKAEKDGMTIEIPIDSTIVTVNGTEQEIDVPAMIVEGRTLVPLRFVGEALDGIVHWDETNRVVNILFSVPDGQGNYESAVKEMNEKSTLYLVDGAWLEPYAMDVTEGMAILVFHDEQALELFHQLSAEDKGRYLNRVVYEQFAQVIGCNPVYTRVVWNNKMYYEGQFVYEKRGTPMELLYYSNGKLCNVIEQDKEMNDYKMAAVH